VLEIDWKPLRRGNVKEIKSQIDGEYATSVVALATIKTVEKEGEVKEYQNVYNKGFLPSYMGNTVVVPSEITTKAGSDFDIDKLNMYLKAVYTDHNGDIKLVKYRGSEEETKEYYGKIFDKVRPKKGFFGELLSCSMCTGFWVGLLLWLINPLTNLYHFDSLPLTGFLLACLSSGTSYLLDKIISDEGININKE
jgi:hypothetical protein